jgi:glycerophosphoryl diester phosphodiesterase
VPPHPYLAHPGPLPIAHRGGTEVAPENSVAAFRAALEVGFGHLETDVHLTGDGVLVAFHDEQLDRATDGTGTVADLPWSTVRQARIGGSEPIPTLDELLEEFPDARFNIDPKSDHVVVALVAALRRHDALDRVCLGAFSDDRLRRLRSLLGPGLCSAAGPREVAGLIRASKLGRAGAGSARSARDRDFDCVQVPVRHLRVEIVTADFVRTAHQQGVDVHVWTIDEADEMHRLLDLGVDGIMTDRPSVLRSVLVERGQWM